MKDSNYVLLERTLTKLRQSRQGWKQTLEQLAEDLIEDHGQLLDAAEETLKMFDLSNERHAPPPLLRLKDAAKAARKRLGG